MKFKKKLINLKEKIKNSEDCEIALQIMELVGGTIGILAVAGIVLGSVIEFCVYANTGSFRWTQQYKVIGKKGNEIAIQHKKTSATYVLSFDDWGHDSIVYNNVNIGDQLTVCNFSREVQERITIHNDGCAIKYINGNSVMQQLKEYDRQQKRAGKYAVKRAKAARVHQVTARSNTGR